MADVVHDIVFLEYGKHLQQGGLNDYSLLVLQVLSHILSLILPCRIASQSALLMKHLQIFKNHQGLAFKSLGLGRVLYW